MIQSLGGRMSSSLRGMILVCKLHHLMEVSHLGLETEPAA